jgi:hypothetical protein
VEWVFRQTPYGEGFWEHVEVPDFREPTLSRAGRPERGRDRKGRFAAGPQGIVDDADLVAYSRGSDIYAAFGPDEPPPWIPQ